MANELVKIENVRNTLLSLKKPSYLTTNKKELRVRCPYCGDSKNDKTHAHLYIEMQPPFKLYCQRCSTAGVLNQQTLRDLGIFNGDLSTSVIELAKTVKRNSNEKINYKTNKVILDPVESQQSNNIKNYISNRFNLPFELDYIVKKFKVVSDARKFFADNNINVPPGQYDFDNSIGFVSSDSSHVIFRDMTNKQAKRYYNLNLQPWAEKATTNKMYNIRSGIDMLSQEVNLIMTEGIFDIVGVYEYFYKDKIEGRNNYIFASANGKGYAAVIMNYMRMGFLNLNITIYSDADVNTYFFKALKENLPYIRTSNITVYYNEKDKDFGVPLDQIKLKKVII
jgi:uncharacterized Zn-finger protein